MSVSQFTETFWLFFTATENFTLDHQVDGAVLTISGVADLELLSDVDPKLASRQLPQFRKELELKRENGWPIPLL